MSAVTLILVWKLFFSTISGGILYTDVRNSVDQHKPMFTLIAIGSLIIFIVSICEVIWHIKGGDSRYPFLNMVFEVYIKKDAEALYWQNITANQKPLEECQSYIRTYPQGKFLEQANECIEQRMSQNDSRDFDTAKYINTIPAYIQYMNGENHSHKAEAQTQVTILEDIEKKEEFEWTQISKTIDGCQSYIYQHPKSKFLKEANTCVDQRKIEIDNQNFANAQSENTIPAYTKYINKCLDICKNKEKAEQIISQLHEQERIPKWKLIELTQTIEQCLKFLTEYPDSEPAKDCVKKHKIEIDNQNFANAKNKNTISAYSNYINKCFDTCGNKTEAEQILYQLQKNQDEMDRQNKIEYCKKNEEDAQADGAAAALAVGGGTGIATGGGCSLLLLIGFIDGGLSSATCYALATGTTAVAAAQAKAAAYAAKKDKSCPSN